MSSSDPFVCLECSLRWGPAGSSPPCLDLPRDLRRDVMDAVRAGDFDRAKQLARNPRKVSA